MTTLFTHIRQLLTVNGAGKPLLRGTQMAEIGVIENAWLSVAGGRITGLGPMASCPPPAGFDSIENCTGRIVLPGFVDSHTHIVFAHTREHELTARIQGKTYEQIAAEGGGILNSARKLQTASEEELLQGAIARCNEVLRTGTTTVEVKTGYGLSVEAELKMLRVIGALRQHTPLTIQATVLALHALPVEYRTKREHYVRMMTDELVPAAAQLGIAQYVDAFCETGFFTPGETEAVLLAGERYGLRGRVHANELHRSGGVQVAVKCKAMSADHLECMDTEEIDLLLNSAVVPTVLPGTAFYLGIPYAPARRMIDAGLGIALASDYNPGTCPSGNMPFVLSLACLHQKLLPAETIAAATYNGAAALGLAHDRGSLEVGKRADLLLTQPLNGYAAIPYFFSRNVIDKVMIGGAWV
jgi:imidazolonepropionase